MLTRADLIIFPAFAQLHRDSAGNPCVYRRHFECWHRSCEHMWTDDWSCGCDDQCPECGAKDCSPYAVSWIGPTVPALTALWEALPEKE